MGTISTISKNLVLFHEQFAQNTNCDLPFSADSPMSMIRELYDNCTECALSKDRQSIVFGYGAIRPKIMFIGLGPSNYDSEIGIPFSDIPGRKLQGIVEFLTRGYKNTTGLKLANNVYYTNLILCPFTKSDVVEEVATCKQRLDKEIALVKPENIILLGFDTAKAFFEDREQTYVSDVTSYVVCVNKMYSTVYVLNSLKELCFKRDAVKNEVKNTLLNILDDINDTDRSF